MSDIAPLTNETKAILLLCGRFGTRYSGAKPLTQTEFYDLVRVLEIGRISPGRLLEEGPEAFIPSAGIGTSMADRLVLLLGRTNELEQVVDAWSQAGIWVLSGTRFGAWGPRFFVTGGARKLRG